MISLERQINNQVLERYHGFLNNFYKPNLETYLRNLNKKINFLETNELTKTRIMDIIYRNTLMSKTLGSKEFLDISNGEKALMGGEYVKVGAVLCIDGRLPIAYQFGRIINTKEIAGSLISLSENGKTITDRRFISILDQAANENRELLEIVTAHTSLRHKDHRCGAIAKGLAKGTFHGEPDEVATEEAEKRAGAIETKYNEILLSKDKKAQKKVALTVIIDTDTMGLILNFGKGNQLSTTEITKNLASKITQKLENIGGFGSMKETFNDPKSYIDYSKKVLKVTSYLMKEEVSENESSVEEINKYIDQYYNDLTPVQKNALLFTICRTIANQYVTGLASEQVSSHYYLDHGESYMDVSPPGKPWGRFDPKQSFASVPADRNEMLSQVTTKLELMDKNNGEKPYILFVSTPISKQILAHPDITLVEVEDAAIVYFQKLFKNKNIKNRVKEGSLIIVPMLINEENGEALAIRDYSIYL